MADIIRHHSSGNSKQRRKSVPFRPPNATPNYLALLKSCVGRGDLSKVSMPVEFNEPLSMLQRQTEELEYAHLLDMASLEPKHSPRRLAFVCAFDISGYSTVGQRATKPFNPLLGETFECDRRADRGWRLVAEQFSHHPPGSLLHAEGHRWCLEQQYVVESRVRGTSICLHPAGCTQIRFDDGDVYTYGKLSSSTSLNSILNGGSNNNGTKNGSKLSAATTTNTTECAGQLTVANVGTPAAGILTFHPDKNARISQQRVTGTLLDADGRARCRVDAVWNKWASISNVDGKETEIIWTANALPENANQMHGFTQFALELNEEEVRVAPTDSRRRPDQKLCELGEFGAANRIKKCLEEAQRQRLREMLQQGQEYRPLWFVPLAAAEEGNGTANSLPIAGGGRRNTVPSDKKQQQMPSLSYKFTGDYWRAKETKCWDICPELFAV